MSPPKSRYAWCKVCGKRIAERKDGSLRAHGRRQIVGRLRIVGTCPGSYADGSRS
jgi:hypothetical protein